MPGRVTVPTREAWLRHTTVGTPEECWPWTGVTNNMGYGTMYVRFAKGVFGRQLAHRVSWFLEHGKWPEQNILHTCDTPLCVNPAHLIDGSQAENMRQAIERGRVAYGGPMCPHGHEFTPENTYLWHGSRLCKECRRAASRRAYWARKPT